MNRFAPKPCAVATSKTRVTGRHPGLRRPQVFAERALETVAQEGRGGLADLPILVSGQAMDRALDILPVGGDQRPKDDGGQLLVDPPRMLEQAGGPVAAHERGRALRPHHGRGARVLRLLHPAALARSPQDVRRGERIARRERLLEGALPVDQCRCRPTNRSMRSQAASIFSIEAA